MGEPGRAYFDELHRVAKHYIVWGCNYFNYEFAPGRIVWDKCKKGTSFSDCELAATDIFNTVRLFRFMWNGMLQGKRERDALEDEYNGLGGLAMDGMPHSSAPGNPTEALAVRVIENGVKNRLQEISVQVEVLEGDAANIRGALDAVNGKYKSVIIMRLIRGYSWTKISGKLGVPDSTARNWHGRAVERLGEVLEDVPMVDELTERATRART